MINRLLTPGYPKPVCFLFSTVMLLIVSLGKEPLAQQTRDAGNAILREINVLLVLDNSGSMKRNDPDFLIKKAVYGFAGELMENSRLAIVLFDTNAKIILELTKISQSDFDSLLSRALGQIDYRGRRTDLPGGIDLALGVINKETVPGTGSVVVFLTDGIVDLGSRAKNVERSRVLRETLLPAIKQQGIRVYGIALSKSADLHLIQDLSSGTAGGYQPVSTASEILPAFQKINELLNEEEFKVVKQGSGTGADQQEGIPGPETGPAVFDPVQSTGGDENSMNALESSVEADTEAAEEPVIDQTNAGLVAPESDGMGEPFYKRIAGQWVVIGMGLFVVALVLIAFIHYRRETVARKAVMQKSEFSARLIDMGGDTDEEKTYTLGDKPIRIGRSKRTNDIVIDQFTVSSQHAIINCRDGKYYLCDLGSTNGTFVNDHKVGKAGKPGEVCLKNHDLVSIARYKFRFRCKESQRHNGRSGDSGFDEQTMITPTVLVGQRKSPDETVIGRKI